MAARVWQPETGETLRWWSGSGVARFELVSLALKVRVDDAQHVTSRSNHSPVSIKSGGVSR